MTTPTRSSTSQGVILILIGLVAFFLPIYTAYSITTVLGVLLIISGVLYVIGAFTHKSGNYVSQLLFGLVGIIVGILFLTHGLTIMSIILGIWFVLFGLAMFHRAFALVTSTWAMVLMVITGIVAILFAIELFSGWPYSALSVMGQMAGIVFVLQGISFLCKPSS
jgi:uncharacterized membrane protein HdeD (DUF308 family)